MKQSTEVHIRKLLNIPRLSKWNIPYSWIIALWKVMKYSLEDALELTSILSTLIFKQHEEDVPFLKFINSKLQWNKKWRC